MELKGEGIQSQGAWPESQFCWKHIVMYSLIPVYSQKIKHNTTSKVLVTTNTVLAVLCLWERIQGKTWACGRNKSVSCISGTMNEALGSIPCTARRGQESQGRVTQVWTDQREFPRYPCSTLPEDKYKQ